MSRILPAVCILCLLFMTYGALAASDEDDKVEIDVAGYINHGPMQPTIKAIKEVFSKYDDDLDVEWIDLETEEGEEYFEDNDLSAHLNIIINGCCKYKLNGKEVTFQWFEGNYWTKRDLDNVISDTLSDNGKAIPISD